MDKHDFVQELNYLAIAVLEKLGNSNPSQAQIDTIEALLFCTVAYSNPVSDHEIAYRNCVLQIQKQKPHKIAFKTSINTNILKNYQKILHTLFCESDVPLETINHLACQVNGG